MSRGSVELGPSFGGDCVATGAASSAPPYIAGRALPWSIDVGWPGDQEK